MSEQKRFTFRCDPEIFAKVEKESEEERRNISKQIELILAEYYKEKEQKENR